MRIRRGRVAGAVVGILAGPPVAFLAVMRATLPSPSSLDRSIEGPDHCYTGAILENGLTLEDADRTEVDASDEQAAAILEQATRCDELDELDWQRLFDVYELARRGLGWIEERERGEVALDHALDVLELFADQRRVGPLVNLGIASGLSSEAADLVERELFHVPADAREDAGRRLAAIAIAPLDWDEVAVREERSMWQVLGLMIRDPSAWRELPAMPGMLIHARRGTHFLVDELARDVRIDRLRAASLAAAVELADDLDGPDGCDEQLAVAPVLAGAGIRLTVDPELCVVAAASGDDVRLASPWSGVLDSLRERAQ